MTDWIIQWYGFLSTVTSSFNTTVGGWTYSSQIPLFTALLLGLVGSASPCQLTTSASALAYVCGGRSPRQTFQSALAYTLGKATGYTVIGLVVIILGVQLTDASIPIVTMARKALGPLMILVGLIFLGVLRLNFSAGQGISARLSRLARSGDSKGAYVLGLAFSVSFCPTLFWLFFGLLIPLALSSPVGPVLPGVFALGTALPFLGLAGLLGFGITKAQGYMARAVTLERRFRKVVGVIFLVAGINDTIVYWFI